MRRNALWFGMLALTVGLVGCNDPKKSTGDDQSVAAYDYQSPALYEPAPQPVEADYSGEMMASAPYQSYPGVAAESPVAPAGNAMEYNDGGRQTHVVAKGDTLYSLARRYYSDQRRWKEIYEANKSAIGDPNMIRVGQKLVIP